MVSGVFAGNVSIVELLVCSLPALAGKKTRGGWSLGDIGGGAGVLL